MSPVLLTSVFPSHLELEDEPPPQSSSDYSSFTGNVSSTGLPLNSTNEIQPPITTRAINIQRQEYYYRTLSVTLPYTTYTSTILLGDSFPSSNLQPTTYAVPTTSSNTQVQTPGISTGTIVGIVVGLVVGFLALFAVLYVYLLRARQEKRRRRRRRSRRESSATAEGAPPPPPPGGPPGPGPGPFPPAG